ncbi:hypothetical protein U91I_03563 [alpha proteobacterium U9-1i]|nr:hypothetical protein U91I_03563 [alpha proteobacterium U9-1i]
MADLDLPVRAFASQAALEKWLAGQKPDATGIWLKLPKKGAPDPSVTKPVNRDSAERLITRFSEP